jgi:hypothetical protein
VTQKKTVFTTFRPDVQRQVPRLRGDNATRSDVETERAVRDADRDGHEEGEAGGALHHHVLHPGGGASRDSRSRRLPRLRFRRRRGAPEEGVRDESVRGRTAAEGVRHSLRRRNLEAVPARFAGIGLHDGRLQQDVRGLHDHSLARSGVGVIKLFWRRNKLGRFMAANIYGQV